MPRLIKNEDLASDDSEYVPPGSGSHSRKRGKKTIARAVQSLRSTRAPAKSNTDQFLASPRNALVPTFTTITRPGYKHLHCTSTNPDKFWACSAFLWNGAASAINTSAPIGEIPRALQVVEVFDAARRAMETSAGVVVAESCSRCIKYRYECKLLSGYPTKTCVGCLVADTSAKCDHVKMNELDNSEDSSNDAAGTESKPVFSQGKTGIPWSAFMHVNEYTGSNDPNSIYEPGSDNANHSTPKRRRNRRNATNNRSPDISPFQGMPSMRDKGTSTPQKTSETTRKIFTTPYNMRDKAMNMSLDDHQNPVSLISSDEDCYPSPSQQALLTRSGIITSKTKSQSALEKENAKLKHTIQKLQKENKELKRQVVVLEPAAGETEKECTWRSKRVELYEDLYFAMQVAMKDVGEGLRKAHEEYAEFPLVTFVKDGE